MAATAAVRKYPTIMHSCFSVKFYRPPTKFAKVMFSQVSVCPQGGVYPSMYWAGGVSQHALGRGVFPGGLSLGVVCLGGVYRGGIWGTPQTRGRHPPQILRDTVNKRAVRIPLEFILVKWTFNCLLANVSSFSGLMCSVVASPSDKHA